MFDSLALARALTKAGIESEHAEAIAAGIQQAAEHGDHVTRSDFHTAVASMHSKVDAAFDRLNSKVNAALDRLNSKVDADLNGLGSKLNAALDRSNSKLNADLTGLGSTVSAILDPVSDILKAEIRAEVAVREARIYRFLLVQAVAIIGLTVAILKFLDYWLIRSPPFPS